MNNNIITKILGITCLLLVQMTAFAQSRKISGTVTDNNGEPVIGATVTVKGTKTAVVTDLDGKFSFKVPAGSTLVVTYLGYADKEVAATGTGMTINMNGTTVMHMFAVTFIATASGIDITPANLITVAFLSICAAMGCPAIPIAGTTLIVTILSGMGWTSDLCMIAYALVVAINRPVEMALLPLNVIGDATVNVIVNKKENELDETKYNA